MPWWTWIALGLFVATFILAAGFAFVAWRRLGGLQRTGEVLAQAIHDVARKSEELERRAEHASERVKETEERLGRVNGSLERLGVLSWALGDARRGLESLRGAVRK